jgi:hypothetical protein
MRGEYEVSKKPKKRKRGRPLESHQDGKIG